MRACSRTGACAATCATASAARGARAATASYDEIVELLGLEALLERRPHELSGGERKRVAIGRALLARPRLLLLDEPLASIDRARRQELLPYLEQLRDRFRIPIVYVSHQFEEVMRLATHVVLIREGRVAAQGDVASVSRDPMLRAVLGPDAAGAVVEGEVESVDGAGVARVRIGAGRIAVPAQRAAGLARARTGARQRGGARDRGAARIAQSNLLEGRIAARGPDGPGSELVEVDVGGPRAAARACRRSAPRRCDLAAGRRVWLVVTAARVRGGFSRRRELAPEPAAARRRRARSRTSSATPGRSAMPPGSGHHHEVERVRERRRLELLDPERVVGARERRHEADRAGRLPRSSSMSLPGVALPASGSGAEVRVAEQIALAASSASTVKIGPSWTAMNAVSSVDVNETSTSALS